MVGWQDRRGRFWAWLVVWLAVMTYQAHAQEADMQALIGQVKETYAPDRRVAIYDVEVVRSSGALVLKGKTNLPRAKEALLAALRDTGMKFVDSLRVLVPERAVVNVSVCNLRSEPRHSAELSTQSLLGTPLRIYERRGSWSLVQTPDGYLGWLDEGAFVPMSPMRYKQWREGDKAIVHADADFVVSAQDGPRVTDVVQGNILRLLGQEGSHYQVSCPDGRAGLISKQSCKRYQDFLAEQLPTSEEVLETARRFMGRPYLWGGTSGRAMDCSGYTKTVFYLHGLMLPRDASQQVHVGLPIDTDRTLKNLLPGDFLFFGRKATDTRSERITHVGIYLGDGKMIHASQRVRIQSLRPGDPDFAPERLKTFIRAKRMLADVGRNGVLPLRALEDYKQ